MSLLLKMFAPRLVLTASLVLSLLGLSLTACDSSGGKKSTTNSNSTSSSGTANSNPEANSGNEGKRVVTEPVFGTATIKGRVALEGDPPPTKAMPMTGDQYCVPFSNKNPVPKTQVGENGGLPYVFVYIKSGISAKYPPPEEPAVLDQTGCMYEPHVFGLVVDQTLNIINSDATAHNVNAQPKKNQKFNVAQATKGMSTSKVFTRPEIMVKFKCDVHGWMSAYCGVVSHPFFTVTDKDGNFSIDKLPPGDYTIETWHELYDTRTMEVSIDEGETEEIEIRYAKGK